MAFGIIRARNLKFSEIGETEKHNARLYNSEKEYPKNINPYNENRKDNRFYHIENDDEIRHIQEKGRLKKDIEKRLEKNNVVGIRSNTNVAIEYVITINDKNAWENYPFSSFADDTKVWLEKKHGIGSVVAQYEHYDESNPHAHFIVIPLKEKEIKWKNKNGQGSRKETRINTKEFTGGREKLRQLQDDWFNHLVKKYGDGQTKPSRLGVPIYRGTKVENQTKEYIRHTRYEIGVLRDELSKLVSEYEKEKKLLKIKEKELQIKEKEFELKLKEEDKIRYKNNWDKKGMADTPVIFHSSSASIPNEEPNQEQEKRRSFRR